MEFSGKLERLFQEWDRCRGDKIMPRRKDLPLARMTDILRDFGIMQIVGDDLIYRYCGSEMARRAGTDMTGASLLTLFPEDKKQNAFEFVTPAVTHPFGFSTASTGSYPDGRWSRTVGLNLPMTDATGEPRFLIGLSERAALTDDWKYENQQAPEFRTLDATLIDLGAGVPYASASLV